MYKVAVLLSCYNGEKYIETQINSILNQEKVQVAIFARDDGSTDSTCSILEKYQKKYPDFYWINNGAVKNIGICNSFFRLLEYACQKKYDYYAFADQDDFWLPNKIFSAVDLLRESQNSKGALYYSNKTFVDADLNLISNEDIKVYDDYLEIIEKCLASGCTMVMNSVFAEYSVHHSPTIHCIHDAWIYRMAKMIQADIYFDKNSYILYRQHSRNVCGIQTTKLFDFSSKHIKNAIRKRVGKREHFNQRIIDEIYKQTKNDMSNDYKSKTIIVLNYNKNLKNKFKLMFFDGINKRSLSSRILWIEKVLFNTI